MQLPVLPEGTSLMLVVTRSLQLDPLTLLAVVCQIPTGSVERVDASGMAPWVHATGLTLRPEPRAYVHVAAAMLREVEVGSLPQPFAYVVVISAPSVPHVCTTIPLGLYSAGEYEHVEGSRVSSITMLVSNGPAHC